MKRLIKFSETMHNVNDAGTISVLIGNENILKISPADIIALFLVQLNSLPQNERGISEESIIYFINKMNIPKDVICDVVNQISGLTIEHPLEILVNENKINKDEEIISFLKLFINKECPVNHFSKKELDKVSNDMPLDKLKEILEQNGFTLKEHTEEKITICMRE